MKETVIHVGKNGLTRVKIIQIRILIMIER
jgi:hypothetical protein